METHKPTIVNQGLKFGLILGFVQIAILLLLYMIDKNMLVSMWVGIVSFLIAITLLVLPVKNFKTLQGGQITFKEAFMVCIVTAAGALLLSSVFNFLLYNIIDPSLPEFIKQQAIEKATVMMEKFGSSQEDIEKALTSMESQDFSQSPSRLGSQYFWGVIIYSIPALIIAAILRTKPQPVDDIQ